MLQGGTSGQLHVQGLSGVTSSRRYARATGSVAAICVLWFGRASGQEWKGTVSLTIGGNADTPESHMFQHVRGLFLSNNGQIVVVDAEANSIRVFDGKAALVATAGQRGQGPGDLLRPCCVARDAQGRLWVFDEGNSRFAAFALDARGLRYLTAVRTPVGARNDGASGVRWSANGRLLAIEAIRGMAPLDRRLVRYEIDEDSRILRVDTMPTMTMVEGKAIELRKPSQGSGVGASTVVTPPFAPGMLFAIGDRGDVATGSSGTYRIDWRDGAGRPKAVLSRAGLGPEVTPTEIKATQDYFARMGKEYRTDVSMPIPRRKPVLAGISFDQEGRLWVARTVAKGEARESDLFGQDGTFIAHVTWPKGVATGVIAARGRQAIATMVDPDGVVSVVKVEFK